MYIEIVGQTKEIIYLLQFDYLIICENNNILSYLKSYSNVL